MDNPQVEKHFAEALPAEFKLRKIVGTGDTPLPDVSLFAEEFPRYLARNRESLASFAHTRPGLQEVIIRDFLSTHGFSPDALSKAAIDGAVIYAAKHACQTSGECATVVEILLGGELEKLLAKPKGMGEKKFADFCRELASDFAVFIGGKISGGISEFVEMKGSHETFVSFFLMSTRFGEFLEKHKLDSRPDIYKPLVAALENARQAVLDMKSIDAKKAFPQPMAIFGKPTDKAIFVDPKQGIKNTGK